MDRVVRVVRDLCAVLVKLEPGAFDGEAAATLAEELAVAEKVCAAAKVRMAARAAEGGAHRARGHADVQDWLAAAGGATARDARVELETLGAVEACPDTRAALVNGAVSLAQAAEIAKAEREVPGVEAALLDVARGGSLGVVRIAAQAAPGGDRA